MMLQKKKLKMKIFIFLFLDKMINKFTHNYEILSSNLEHNIQLTISIEEQSLN